MMLETCCAAKHDEIVEGMVEDPVWSRALLRRLEAEALTGHELRRVAESDGGLVLDWQLDIQRVSFATARDFVARHHAHCAGPCAWRFGAAVWNGWTLLGVVIVGNLGCTGLRQSADPRGEPAVRSTRRGAAAPRCGPNALPEGSFPGSRRGAATPPAAR